MDLKPIFENVIEGNVSGVEAGVKSALAAGVGCRVWPYFRRLFYSGGRTCAKHASFGL